MQKTDAEKAIRYLCGQWAAENPPGDHPSFYQFKNWLNQKGYSRYLSFRSRMGANYDAEMWFDQEFKQEWRN